MSPMVPMVSTDEVEGAGAVCDEGRLIGRRSWGALGLCLVCALALPAEAGAAGPRVHVVRPGETPKKIAERYGVSLRALCRANDLREDSRLRPHQRLLVPSSRERQETEGVARTPPPSKRQRSAQAAGKEVQAADNPAAKFADWRRYLAKPASPGEVTLEGRGRSWKGRVDLGAARVPGHVQEAFRRVLFSHRTGKEIDVSPRLIRLLVQVSDAFGGRPLHVVSGYRETSTASKSRHKTGQACDFYVAGVPNEALVGYLRTLPRVGVGYYPNSTFVHLDVRAKTAWWTDVSAPGEAPRYVPESWIR